MTRVCCPRCARVRAGICSRARSSRTSWPLSGRWWPGSSSSGPAPRHGPSNFPAPPRRRARPLLAVVGSAAQYYAAPSGAFVWMVVWDLVVGAGFGAAGCVVTIVDRRSTAGRFLLLAAMLLLVAPTVLAAGQPNLAAALWLAVVAVVGPLLLLPVVQPPSLPRALRVFDPAVVVP